MIRIVLRGMATLGLLAGLMAWTAPAANALPLNISVPSNAFITQGGLDWAWAAPCAPTEPSCGVIDLSFQSGEGWRLPTAGELAIHPLATDFVFAGANVPLGGASPNGAIFHGGAPDAAACAAPFFSTVHVWCDWNNGNANLWAGLPGTASFWETLVVRGEGEKIPEPASLAIFGLGLLGLGLARRRRRSV